MAKWYADSPRLRVADKWACVERYWCACKQWKGCENPSAMCRYTGQHGCNTCGLDQFRNEPPGEHRVRVIREWKARCVVCNKSLKGLKRNGHLRCGCGYKDFDNPAEFCQSPGLAFEQGPHGCGICGLQQSLQAAGGNSNLPQLPQLRRQPPQAASRSDTTPAAASNGAVAAIEIPPPCRQSSSSHHLTGMGDVRRPAVPRRLPRSNGLRRQAPRLTITSKRYACGGRIAT